MKCNLKKANRTPEEARMVMNKKPHIPSLLTEDNIIVNIWNDYQKSFI